MLQQVKVVADQADKDELAILVLPLLAARLPLERYFLRGNGRARRSWRNRRPAVSCLSDMVLLSMDDFGLVSGAPDSGTVYFGTDDMATLGKHGPASDCHQEGGAGCGVNGKLCDGGFKRRRLGDTWEGLPPPPAAMFQPCPKLNTAGLLSPSDPQRNSRAGRSFLTIRHNASVYHTEEWKPRGCTMYLPLSQDVMINTRNVDQLSFENDQFFLADGKGNYIGAKSGNAIHFWRYDTSTKRLFISQSILFLREQDHREALEQLEWL